MNFYTRCCAIAVNKVSDFKWTINNAINCGKLLNNIKNIQYLVGWNTHTLYIYRVLRKHTIKIWYCFIPIRTKQCHALWDITAQKDMIQKSGYLRGKIFIKYHTPDIEARMTTCYFLTCIGILEVKKWGRMTQHWSQIPHRSFSNITYETWYIYIYIYRNR